MQKRAIFFDKDGTLLEDVPYNVDPTRIRFTKGAEKALSQLHSDYQFHIVTNQAGVALGYFEERALVGVKLRLSEMFDSLGVKLHGFHYCPHHPEGSIPDYSRTCGCRKPGALMLVRAALQNQIDLKSSWMVGDILDDIEAGKRAGCRTILIDNGNETEWVMTEFRKPDFRVRDLEEAAQIITRQRRLSP